LIDAVELAAAVVLIAVVTVAGDITGGIAAGFAGQAVAVTGIDIAFRDCLSGTA
jgi:hypothetical protein